MKIDFKDIQRSLHNHEIADYMYERIVGYIDKFESYINEDEEAALSLSQFNGKPILIKEITYSNPDMLIFYGVNSDNLKVQLLMHLSQLNLCLVAVKRSNHAVPRRKIGFSVESQED